jgi:hypothetical protein
MTTPARPAAAGDLEPGWSHDEPNPLGPCYQRHVPGKGILRVVARGGQGYAWYLSATSRSESLSRARERFAGPRNAMRDADQQVPLRPRRMFELLTPGETQELYRKLARACDWGRPGQPDLDEVRGELFEQMKIQATDPGYHGPDPHKFIHAVREASSGAALQAMSASPNRGSWLSMRPHGRSQRLAAAADFPGPPVVSGVAPRRRAGSTASAAQQARPGRLR